MTTKTPLPHIYESIQGWFDFQDIYKQAVEEAQDGDVFVEIGSWRGCSAAFMAVEIANSGKNIRLFCVDPWSGDLDGQKGFAGNDVYVEFLANMARTGTRDIVKPLRATSEQAATDYFYDGGVAFVFIDGEHGYEAVSKDIRLWLPKVRSGGVIAGHDTDWEGLRAGVQDSLPWSRVVERRSSWWHRVGRDTDAEGTWRHHSKATEPPETLIYVPNVNTPGFLDKALASLGPWTDSAVVIDSSPEGHVPDRDVDVYRPKTKLSFTQMQNWALDRAHQYGCEHLVFMHADAECAEPDALDRLVAELRAAPPTMAGLFTSYDALSIWRVEALRKVGAWDETFEWYYADNDYYRRVRLAGFEIGCSSVKVHHHASATIASDMQEKRRVDAVNIWARDHYAHKWGGYPDQERFTVPYNARRFR